MTGAAWALQQAVFTALDGAFPGRVFDAVPRGSEFPYLVIGDGVETAAVETTEHTLTLRIWSRAGGHREGKELASAVRAALETTPLTLEDHALIDLRFVLADYARLADGETWRATMRFKALTEISE